MDHRHLKTQTWSAAAVASALERGDLRDWQKLFAVARHQPEVAEIVWQVASTHDLGGASVLAQALIARWRPDLSNRFKRDH